MDKKRYPNVSFFLARNGGCIKMPGDEQKSRNRPENHAIGRPLSRLRLCLYRKLYLTNYDGNKTPKCFSCPGDSKELSKKTKRSTYDSNQARTKPWPTRPPTSDNNSPITKRIRTNETPKCFSSLGDCSGLSKEARR